MTAKANIATRQPDTADPTADSDLLGKTLASLTPTLEILERFHHRNRNQHRLSKWWSHADMLRRNLRKFLMAVELRLAEVERIPRSSNSSSSNSKKKKKAKTPEGGDRDDEIRVRAGHLRRNLVPGAYRSFTQLTADRQFAHMGLMLLGVLAQVDNAVSPFAAAAARPTASAEEMFELNRSEGGRESLLGIEARALIPDIGTAVSREEVMMTEVGAVRPQVLEGRECASPPPLHRRDQLRETTEVASPKEAERPRLKKKVKPSGDEFDDIFSGLEKPAKRPKKKRKKGDEFDDIFGGL